MILRSLPLDDVAAWHRYPDHRWIYCRLAVAGLAGVRSGPAGVEPPHGPILWKPIINLWGMGRGAFVASEPHEHRPGLMWSELLTGRHVSTDAVVTAGRVAWSAQALGLSDGPSRFSAWFLGESYLDELDVVQALVRDHLADFTGGLNVETIGGRMIEVHLRLTQDWLRAGAYDAFPAPCARMIGVPLWHRHSGSLPEWIREDPDDGDPRHGFLTAVLSEQGRDAA